MLKVENISKIFGKTRAVNKITINFKPGIYGLIGPNGAGKSSLINMLTTSIKPTHGSILFEDQDIKTQSKYYRSLIGYMPQNQQGYKEFSGLSFLYYMANLKGVPKDEAKVQIDKLVTQVGLVNSIQRKLKTYSGGMLQRVMFAQALLGDPKIVILDEPTAGLDPFERIKLRNYISQVAEGRIVLIATHVMQDIESIADRIILMKSGDIPFFGTGKELLDSIDGFVHEKEVSRDELQHYQSQYRISRVYKYDDNFLIRYLDDKHHGDITPTFEDAYIYYLVDYVKP